MAADTLQQHGRDCILLDKGRQSGGRMSTRHLDRTDPFSLCDHGAQYFTARSDRFKQIVNEWLSVGIARVWTDGFMDDQGTSHFNGDPRYIGVDGMNGIPRYLTPQFNVHQVRVTQIDQADNQFVVQTEEGEWHGRHLLLTPPAEQSLTLIHSGNITLPISAQNALRQIHFDPCFAVIAWLSAPSKIPAPGGLFMHNPEPIRWLADNQQKGITPHPIVTIHAGAQFTRAHFEADRDEVAKMLIDAAAPYLGSSVIAHKVQRWKYSIPVQLHPERTLCIGDANKIAFAGDAFGGARVEGAVLSGYCFG